MTIQRTAEGNIQKITEKELRSNIEDIISNAKVDMLDRKKQTTIMSDRKVRLDFQGFTTSTGVRSARYMNIQVQTNARGAGTIKIFSFVCF